MKKVEFEMTRQEVTPAQFLAQVRHHLKKRGMRDLASDLDLAYFKAGNDLNFDYTSEDRSRPQCEKSVSKPYEMQTYIKNWKGEVYNEICEFQFWDEQKGTGYYYLLNMTNDEE